MKLFTARYYRTVFSLAVAALTCVVAIENAATEIQEESVSSTLPHKPSLQDRIRYLTQRAYPPIYGADTIVEEESLNLGKYFSGFKDSKDDDKTFLIVKWTTEKGYNTVLNMTHTKVLRDFKKDSFVALQVDNDQLDTILTQLVLDPDIEAIEEDSQWFEQGSLDAILTDDEQRNLRSSGGSRQLAELTPYGITMVQGDQVSVGSTKVIVCIVDTGVALHPDLDFSRITGVDHMTNKDNVKLKWNGDTRGHGTHIAGTISAKTNNGIGVRGMGAIPLYITRGLNNDGTALESDVRDAMEQCEAAGAKIISLSLAGTQMSAAMTTIVDRLYSKGVLIFAASGNGGGKNKAFPAANPKVISIGAVGSNGLRWSGSNYGWNELMGPGNLVTSTTVNTLGSYIYANYSGTSMATPHAAGAAALLWSNFPACTNTQIRYALAYTSKDVGNTGCDSIYGYGIIQTKKAYDFLTTYSCKSANWGQKVTTDGLCSSIDAAPVKAKTTSASSSSSSWTNPFW